jgi:hypothetical protein
MKLPRSLLVLAMLPLTACSTLADITHTETVKPWDRGLLAQDSLQLEPDAMQSYVDDHIYFSREASTGGKGIGGGGCGCN